MTAAVEAVDKDKMYEIAEAVKIVKGNAKAKFDETIELCNEPGRRPAPRRSERSGCGRFAKRNGQNDPSWRICQR